MKKYQILVEGNNFLLKSSIKNVVEKYGFYTTRCVEAETSEEAFEIVKDLIRSEIKRQDLYNRDGDPPILYPDEVDEVSSFGDLMVPGKGFTWFLDVEDNESQDMDMPLIAAIANAEMEADAEQIDK